jgi:hypothetical protein
MMVHVALFVTEAVLLAKMEFVSVGLVSSVCPLKINAVNVLVTVPVAPI